LETRDDCRVTNKLAPKWELVDVLCKSGTLHHF